MTIQQRLAGIALAVATFAAAVPASAQSTASAFVGNLSYQLIDLAPDDGIAPYLTFTGASNTFARASLYADPVFGTLVADSQSTGELISSVNVSTTSGTADASGSPFAVFANTNLFSNSGASLAFGTMDFILSPYTRVIFSVTASVDAEPDFTEGGLGNAFASALLYGEVGNDSSAGSTNFSSSTFTLFLREDRTLSALVDTQAFETTGFVAIQAVAESASLATPVSSVPEPASLGMLLAGLGLLSGAARRRQRKQREQQQLGGTH
jgi:hypothetical protein